MPRSMWSGTVSFGMVAIPVDIVPAIRPSRVNFHMLHEKDYSRLQRRMLCPAENIYVHREHIVRGYEIEPDNYIVVHDDELRALEPKRSETIEIEDFVELESIDAMYYDRPYYLQPRKGGDKPYSLLARVLSESGKAGIAKFVMRDREYLVALRSNDNVLVLLTLHWIDDLVSGDELAPDAETSKQEVTAMEKAIKKKIAAFEPENYHDQTREKIAEHIRRKQQQNEQVQAPEAEPEPEESDQEEAADLISALEESLSRVQDKKKK